MYDSFIIDGTKIYVLLFAFVVSYNVFFLKVILPTMMTLLGMMGRGAHNGNGDYERK